MGSTTLSGAAGAGGPLAVLVIAIIAAEFGKAVSKETKIDILVTPLVTILSGVGLASLIAPAIGTAASSVGEFVAAEIKNGNADYIIKVLDTVKQRSSLPDISNIASVSSNAPVSGAASDANANGESLTPDQIANYRFKVQTGEMSRDEFRQIMARHREASKLR